MQCVKCGKKTPKATLDVHLNEAKSLVREAVHKKNEGDWSQVRSICEALWKHYAAEGKSKNVSNCLHPRHEVLCNSLSLLLNACNYEGDYTHTVQYTKQIIDCMKIIFPPAFPETANFLFSLGESIGQMLQSKDSFPKKAELQYREEMLAAFKESHDMRVTCLGAEHPFTQQALARCTPQSTQ
eukprot:GFYU01018474.1.p1 GENE.GFYU01018474.1~~GFYU01018474.1.p1  ORF type:complete len:183 (+),score=49.60 GFYU01018474.1:2-550(+)